MSSVTANSRMIYAFSRDGALPGSAFWHRVNKRTRTPTNAIWLAAAGALLLGLPYLWNYAAYAAVTSIAVIGLYIAYVMPTFLRLRQGDNFQRGPWHLGRWSKPIGIIAVAWVMIITILFMLPQVSPITAGNFNYTVSRSPSCSASRVSTGWSRPASGSPARGFRARPRNWPRSSSELSVAGLSDAHAGADERTLIATASSAGCSAWSGSGWRSVRARSTPSCSPSPTCRAGSRASGCRAEFFLDEVAEHYSEGCNYLLAVDVEMNTVDGYAMSSWETGYGDFVLRPGPGHHAPAALASGHRAVIADLTWLDGTPVAASPRQILRGSWTGSPSAAGGAGRHRAGVHRLQRHLRAGRGEELPRPHPGQPVQRGLLDPGHLPDRAPAAPDPQRHGRRRACTSSRPRASATSASTRSPSGTPRR